MGGVHAWNEVLAKVCLLSRRCNPLLIVFLDCATSNCGDAQRTSMILPVAELERTWKSNPDVPAAELKRIVETNCGSNSDWCNTGTSVTGKRNGY